MTTPSTMTSASLTSVTPTTPGGSELGWGVNALDADILGAGTYLQPIFDPSKLFPGHKAPIPQIANFNKSTQYKFQGVSGYAYLVSQSVSVGVDAKYAGFSGSLSASFNTTSSSEFTENYGTYQYVWQSYQLTIPASSYQSILSSGFEQDLNDTSLAPLDFYNKYGPYFTSTVMVGGTLTSSIYTAAQTTYTDQTMSASASAAYNEGISSGKAQASYTYTDTATETDYTCTAGITAIGGNAADIPIDPTTGAIDVSGWQSTVSDEPATISYTLTPMYSLATGQRQADLHDALDAYFSQPNPYLLAPLSLKTFTATSTAGPTPSMDVTVDAGYKVLGGGASMQPSTAQWLTASSVVQGAPPNQWNASSKQFYEAAAAAIESYVIAVYDPADLLDVEVSVVSSGPTTLDTYSFMNITAQVGAGYTMTGGGIATHPTNTNGLMILASYPASQTEWSASASCHANEACSGTVDVSVIGVKWRNPAGKPPLVMVPTEITSNVPAKGPSQTVSTAAQSAMVGGGVSINSGSAAPARSEAENALQSFVRPVV